MGEPRYYGILQSFSPTYVEKLKKRFWLKVDTSYCKTCKNKRRRERGRG